MAANSKTAAAKVAATSAPVELVVMAVLEPIKYAGKRHLPGDALLASPDDMLPLIEAGLAEVAAVPEEKPVE